jgi:hypothetical protein
MQTALENKIEQLNKSKVPIVAIESSLNKYQGSELFPKKLSMAKEKLSGLKLPAIKKQYS